MVEPVRTAVLVLAVVVAGCGGSPQPPAATPANGETGSGRGRRVAGPPDAGTEAGHGDDLAAQFAQRDPRCGPCSRARCDAAARDAAARSRRRGAGRARLAGREHRGRTSALPRPEFDATALIRDGDGGTGRVRVSVVYITRCDGVERQQADYFPPAQIENVRIAPGVRVPAQRSRSARVRFPAGCDVTGKAFAEATNAAGLESFSDPIWFSYDAS